MVPVFGIAKYSSGRASNAVVTRSSLVGHRLYTVVLLTPARRATSSIVSAPYPASASSSNVARITARTTGAPRCALRRGVARRTAVLLIAALFIAAGRLRVANIAPSSCVVSHRELDRVGPFSCRQRPRGDRGADGEDGHPQDAQAHLRLGSAVDVVEVRAGVD